MQCPTMQKTSLFKSRVAHSLNVYFCFCVWLVTYTFFSDFFLNADYYWLEYLIENAPGIIFIPSDLSLDSLVEVSNLIGMFLSVTLACTSGRFLSGLPSDAATESGASLSLRVGLGFLGASYLLIAYMTFGDAPLWEALLKGLSLLTWYSLWSVKGAQRKLCLIAAGGAVAITGFTALTQVQLGSPVAIPAIVVFIFVTLASGIWWGKSSGGSV